LTNCTGLPNAGLVNSSVTIGGTAIALGASSSTITNDLTISGLTVGKGGGAVASNTAVGASALAGTNTGTYNTGIGYNAAYTNTSGINATAIGGFALYGNTTGNYNTAVGYASVYTNSTGSSNTGVGFGSLNANTTASNNTAVGYQAGYANTTGSNNTALGQASLTSNTTASNNTAVGTNSLKTNTTGATNTAIGDSSLFSSTTASNNTAVGYNSGNNNTTGTFNTLIGVLAGTNITTGQQHIVIGHNSQTSTATVNSELVVGINAVGKGTTTGYISVGGGVYQGNNSTLWSITSDRRLKKNIIDNNNGLDIINQIQVRNFEYRLPEEVTDVPQNQAIAKTGVQLGVIAQELQQILPECVKTESTGVMTVDADNLTWYLVNAVKELSARIKQLEGN
jgi:hypothetical protein